MLGLGVPPHDSFRKCAVDHKILCLCQATDIIYVFFISHISFLTDQTHRLPQLPMSEIKQVAFAHVGDTVSTKRSTTNQARAGLPARISGKTVGSVSPGHTHSRVCIPNRSASKLNLGTVDQSRFVIYTRTEMGAVSCRSKQGPQHLLETMTNTRRVGGSVDKLSLSLGAKLFPMRRHDMSS